MTTLNTYERNREFDRLADHPRRIAELKREIEKLEAANRGREDLLKEQLPQAFTLVRDLPLSPRALNLCLERGYDYAYHLARIVNYAAPEGFGKKTLAEISTALRSIDMPYLTR